MRSSKFTLMKLCAVLAAALLSTACGGGDEDEGGDAAFRTSTGSTTPSAAAISSGKTLYTQYCAGCHGANKPSAKDSGRTLSAIASNKGGMGSLSASIQTSQADDIAAYLAFGL